MSLGNLGGALAPTAWLSEGWRALRDHAHHALAYFKHDEAAGSVHDQRWGLLAADMVEHDDRLSLRIEVPGLNKEQIRVEVRDARVIVTGTKDVCVSRTEGSLHIAERAFGTFVRAIPLPVDVDAERTEAAYKDGVLEIDIPKARSARYRQIAIR